MCLQQIAVAWTELVTSTIRNESVDDVLLLMATFIALGQLGFAGARGLVVVRSIVMLIFITWVVYGMQQSQGLASDDAGRCVYEWLFSPIPVAGEIGLHVQR